MYRDLYKSYLQIRPPFHNRVLRGNYDIPEAWLIEIIALCLSMRDGETQLYHCPDGVEAGFILGGEKLLFPENEQGRWAQILTLNEENQCAGIFDEGQTFYIRAGLEREDEVSAGEQRSGFFELYAPDKLTQAVYEHIKTRFDGFFILESAKKHLDEICI